MGRTACRDHGLSHRPGRVSVGSGPVSVDRGSLVVEALSERTVRNDRWIMETPP